MPAISRSAIISQGTVLIAALLGNNITDPGINEAGSTRWTASGAKFVMTSWPSRIVQYPIITVQQAGYQSQPLGMSTSETLTNLGFEVTVWTLTERQTDQLAGSVVAVLEQNQALTRASGLFDLRFGNITNIDEPGKAGVHRKVIELTYIYPSQ